MGEGRKKLERAYSDMLDKKKDKPRLFKGLLGAFIGGFETIEVSGRPDFVYVRLRGATGEVIQAFNDKVAEVFDLPVMVVRDELFPNIWRIEGRDLGQYGSWGGGSYLPPHGLSHSFVGTSTIAGSDPVWVYKRQYMPFLPRPQISGTNSIFVEQEYYYWNGQFHFWPGSGTTDLITPYRPTGGGAGKFITVFLDGDAGVLDYLEGPEFSLIYPPADPLEYIRIPGADQGIPICAISLQTGTQRIGWQEIYDLRVVASALPSTGSSIHIWDEGVSIGQVSNFNFLGDNIEAIVSGSFVYISVTGTAGGGGAGTVGVNVTDEGVPIGTGTTLDFVGSGVDATRSGSVIQVVIPGLGGETGVATYSLVGTPEPLTSITGQYWRTPGGTEFASGSMNAFIDGISQLKETAFTEQYPASGTYQYLEAPPTGVLHEIEFGIPVSVGVGPAGQQGSQGAQGDPGDEGATGSAGETGPEGATGVQGDPGLQGPSGDIGITVTDEGEFLATGTRFDFVGENIEATASGTVIRVYVTGSSGNGGAGIGGAWSIRYNFTTGAYGTGETNFDSLTGSMVTEIRGNTTDADGASATARMQQMGVEGVLHNLLVIIWSETDTDTWWAGKITSLTAINGSRLFGVEYIDHYGGETPFEEGEPVVITAGFPTNLTGSVVVFDEDTQLGLFKEIRFKGAGVEALDSGSYSAINIPGGGGGGQVLIEDIQLSAAQTVIEFNLTGTSYK
ncbi:hypothetical protein LCGC14_1480540, partial [marine sediment metagenome]